MNRNNYNIMSIPAENISIEEPPLVNCGLMSIGMEAPNFTAETTMGTITMSDFKGKWVVFFSNTAAFSPVCTTELLSFASIYQSFEERNTQVLGLTVDSNLTQLSWLNSIYEEEGVIIPFPIISDIGGFIARQYGMISPFATKAIAARNVLIIDPNQIVRAVLIYPITNGRNIPEVLRLLTALQISDEYAVVTPADWFPGQPVMVPAPDSYEEIIQRKADDAKLGLSCREWWWCYKQLPEGAAQ